MSARILDGRLLADQIRAEVAQGVAELLDQKGIVPGLTVVLVGDDPASAVYVRNKERAAAKAGIRGSVIHLPADCESSRLLDTIDRLNEDERVHGILVQLPLPRHLDEQKVIERMSPAKDVDGFHPENVGRLVTGHPRFVPCTPLGIQVLLRRSGIETRGRTAVILGRSNIVGKPMAALLMARGEGGDATVTVCHTATRDVAGHAREADILVAAMGQARAVRGDWVKPGAVVIDVGIHRQPDGSLCGDVNTDEVAAIAGAITPVPGGVGPMTVALLLRNSLDAARAAAIRA